MRVRKKGRKEGTNLGQASAGRADGTWGSTKRLSGQARPNDDDLISSSYFCRSCSSERYGAFLRLSSAGAHSLSRHISSHPLPPSAPPDLRHSNILHYYYVQYSLHALHIADNAFPGTCETSSALASPFLPCSLHPDFASTRPQCHSATSIPSLPPSRGYPRQNPMSTSTAWHKADDVLGDFAEAHTRAAACHIGGVGVE